MNDREIVVCNNVICSYSEDRGSFEGDIWWLSWPVHLFLVCDPDNAIERLILKLVFEAIFRESETWTNAARLYACNRFLPYFYSVAGPGSERILSRNLLYHSLMPEMIELGVDGEISISFAGFHIGRRWSYLDVSGTISGGFFNAQDNGSDIPTK